MVKHQRRDFLRKTLLASSSIVLLLNIDSILANNYIKTRTRKQFGVCLVGLGYYSSTMLVTALQKTINCRLSAIVTGNKFKAEKWKNKYFLKDENIYDYNNFDSIKTNKEIDIVYIVLPNSMHAEFTIRAANAGKHVICEKPMALNVKECDEMIASCNQNNVSLSIGYRMHYEPHTQEVMRFAKENVFGRAEFISCSAGYKNQYEKTNWKVQKKFGGGAIMDMGVYCIQAARYSTAEEPVSVYAQGYGYDNELFVDVPETATFQLEFPSGAVANLMTTFRTSINFLNVSCSKGWYRLDPFSLYNGIKSFSSIGAFQKEDIFQQVAQLDETAWRIENSLPMLVPGEEGRKDICVVEALNKSLLSGKKELINF